MVTDFCCFDKKNAVHSSLFTELFPMFTSVRKCEEQIWCRWTGCHTTLWGEDRFWPKRKLRTLSTEIIPSFHLCILHWLEFWACCMVSFFTFLFAKFHWTWEQSSVKWGWDDVCQHFTHIHVTNFVTYWIKFTSISNLQSEKLALMESMKQELEEKIRKLEEDKQNMDISAGKIFVLCSNAGLTKMLKCVYVCAV